MDDDFDIENIRQAMRADIITIQEAFAAFRAIKTGDYKIIKELYRERLKNEQTLDAG